MTQRKSATKGLLASTGLSTDKAASPAPFMDLASVEHEELMRGFEERRLGRRMTREEAEQFYQALRQKYQQQ